MNRLSVIICIIILASCAPQKNITWKEQINTSTLTQKVTDKGLVVAYFKNGQLEVIERNGLAKEDGIEIADLTQVFTAIKIHELAEGGLLRLEDPITTYLPAAFQLEALHNITIQECLSHLSGLPRIPSNIGTKQVDPNQPYEHYREEDLIQFLKFWKPPDVKKYQYSLIGYVLLGIVLDQLEKPQKEPIQVVQGFNRIGNTVEPLEDGIFYAAIGKRMSTQALQNHLIKWSGGTDRGFNASIMEVAPTNIDAQTGIASGWHTFAVNKNFSIVLHKGSTSGHSNFMAICPQTNTGVVITATQKVNLGPMGYFILGQLNDGWKKSKNPN